MTNFNEAGLERDEVASRLLPNDCSTDLVPVKNFGDGNCFFRAVALLVRGEHCQLREATMAELKKQSGEYARYLVR